MCKQKYNEELTLNCLNVMYIIKYIKYSGKKGFVKIVFNSCINIK